MARARSGRTAAVQAPKGRRLHRRAGSEDAYVMASEPAPARLDERALAEAEALRRVVEEISSELELDPLLTRIVIHACELLGADKGAIGLYDPAKNVIRIRATYHMPERSLGAERPPGVGLAGTVLERQTPILLARYGDLATITLPELADNSVVGVPIRRGATLVGTFGICASPPRRFDMRDVATLELLARHAAIAIDNAMRYEREKARNERMELISKVSRLVSAEMEPAELVATAARIIHEQLGYPNVAIPLLEGDHLVYRSHSGSAHDGPLSPPYRQPITEGVLGAAVRTRSVQVVNDVRSDPRYIPLPLPIEVTSELAVPIVLGHEVFGVVNVEGRAPFDDDDVWSLRIIADHLAVAIKNAQLFEEARQAAVMRERQRLARELHDSVSQVLSSISLMSQSLVSAYRKDPQEGERRARRLEELSRLAFSEMRALLRELRPVDPDDQAAQNMAVPGSLEDLRRCGLKRALQRLAAVLAPETPEVQLDFARYQSQVLEHEEALFRICQEALSNALRHSGARRVLIRARILDEEHVYAEVADDGSGFDPQAAHGKGFGMRSMRERAAALGGHVVIQSTPGKGTRVIIELPRKDC